MSCWYRDFSENDSTNSPTVFYFNKKWNHFEKPKMTLSVGITTSQFNDKNPISSVQNSIYTLLFKENYLKIYEKTFGKISYTQEIADGFHMSGSLEYLDRVPLFNSTNNTIFKREIPFQSNNPRDPTNFTAPFTPHQMTSLNIGVMIIFGQKYASYPNARFSIENPENPSVSINYRKNFLATNREFHSDLLRMGIGQSASFQNIGTFKYLVQSGIFLQQKDIPFMDYIHLNGNQTDFMLLDRMDRFGLLDYYQFSTNDKYTEAHFEQNFKGFFLRQIPLIKTFNFHLITCFKTLFTPNRKPYFEHSLGLDNLGIGKWRFFHVAHVWSNVGGNRNSGFLFGLSF